MNIQGLAVEVSEEGLTHEQRQTLKAIRQRKKEVVAVHRSKKAVANNQATLPRGADPDRKSNTTNMRVGWICCLPTQQADLQMGSRRQVQSLEKTPAAAWFDLKFAPGRQL